MSSPPDPDLCYHALKAHDRRFDGVFYVGVSSTGIYCRPVCTARVPKRENCTFYHHAAAAEAAGYRPCLRCRPELAPGQSDASVDAIQRLAHVALQQIESGALGEGESLETLANDLGVSSRHLRRAMQQSFGVSPIELAQTHRLLMAKRLLTETSLPIIDVALASGFRSLRRFNALFQSRYEMSPTRFRSGVASLSGNGESSESLKLILPYRPPLAWTWLLAYLKRRAIPGVEHVTDAIYARTVVIQNCRGWVRVTHAPEKHALQVELSASLLPVLAQVLSRIRQLFDLDASPQRVADHFAADEMLGPKVSKEPGLRVPGAFDGFETALRTILGQQISVAAATTMMARLNAAYAEPACTPIAALNRWPLCARQIAGLQIDDFGGMGIIRQRGISILTLARELVANNLRLVPGLNTAITMSRLLDIPGVGPWTVEYLSMRVLRWPDAFPASDLGVRIALGRVTPKEAEQRSQPWRPWRAYAVQHLWHSLETLDQSKPSKKGNS